METNKTGVDKFFKVTIRRNLDNIATRKTKQISEIKRLLSRHLTVDQLDKPVAVIDIIGLTGCDATKLVADTRVLL